MWMFVFGWWELYFNYKTIYLFFSSLAFVKGKKVTLFIVNFGTLDLVDGYLILIFH
jgi:hypothetical protein